MRSRCLLLGAVLIGGACQKKAETIAVPPVEYQKHVPASSGSVVIDQPARGLIVGNKFVPDNVGLDGHLLSFRMGKDVFPEMEISFPVPAAQFENTEWRFDDRKFENPEIWYSVGKSVSGSISPKDYTLVVKITKRTAATIEGSIDLHAKGDTHLHGQFSTTRKRFGNDPLEPDDAPYIHGKVVFVKPWMEEDTAVGFVAGFVGNGTDGKIHSNMAGTIATPKGPSFTSTNLTLRPQITSLAGDDKGVLTYRHTRVPPGEYLVYFKRNRMLIASQKVTLKAGDQLAVDLTIDTSKTGNIIVTLSDAEAVEKSELPVSLRPIGLDVPGTESTFAFDASEMAVGQKSVTIRGVPAGKYIAMRGRSSGEVEVVAGKSSAVTLAREEPKKK